MKDVIALNASIRKDIKTVYEVALFTVDSKALGYTTFFQIKGIPGIYLFDCCPWQRLKVIPLLGILMASA